MYYVSVDLLLAMLVLYASGILFNMQFFGFNRSALFQNQKKKQDAVKKNRSRASRTLTPKVPYRHHSDFSISKLQCKGGGGNGQFFNIIHHKSKTTRPKKKRKNI